MKLNINDIKNNPIDGIKYPTQDMDLVMKNTLLRPKWVHFGAGNIFRGFIARVNQTILDKGLEDTGIIAVDTFDFDIIDNIFKSNDCLSLLVRLNATGESDKEVVGGVAHAFKGHASFQEYRNIINAFESKSLQIVSFTITEKGYALKTPSGEYMGVIQGDMENGPEKPNHVMSIVTSLLLKRFNNGATPLTLCSMDNCAHNGDKLRASVLDIANAWLANGFVSEEFVAYISDKTKVSFPVSMIDKITPRPSSDIQAELEAMGVENMAPIVTSKNTFIAPFVNAEVPEYLVIEDNFVNGRPALEEGGVYITSKEVVNQVETMKVTTCLNPLHTALAVYGCTLGYTRIYEEMKNPSLKALVEKIGYEEGMKVVVDPKIIDPKKFIDEVIGERLVNPYIPDEPQRIATDTSQKLGIRFGETIKKYIAADDLDVNDLTCIPLAIAGWLRYLLAVDDKGVTFELSSDPLLSELTAILADVKLGAAYNNQALEILKNENIFGLDLVSCGLATKIDGMFEEMLAGPGAIAKTLSKYVGV